MQLFLCVLHTIPFCFCNFSFLPLLHSPSSLLFLFLSLVHDLAVFMGLIMFSNHYVRDSVGALEKQLEEKILSPHQYALLNLFYFFPNMITPLIAGMFIHPDTNLTFGFILFITFASVGHSLFAAGTSLSSTSLMYSGRFIGGKRRNMILPHIPKSSFFR